MKLNKVFSLLLTIVLMLNTICVVTAFAEDAQITISGAVTEVQIGTVANGKTPAIATNVTQNGHSVLMNTNGNYASFTVYSPVEAAYKLSLCYGGVAGSNSNINFSVWVEDVEMISSDALTATGDEESATWATVKSVKLKAGVNTLKFERKSGGSTFKFVGFKLETAGIDNVVEIGTGTMTISSDSTASGSKGSISVAKGKFFGLPVNVINEGSYKVYANITSTSASTASVKVGSGEAKAVSIAGAGYAELGIFELSQGLNTINFENTGSNEIKVTGLKFEYTTEKIYADNSMFGSSREFIFRREVLNEDGTGTVGKSDVGLGATDGCGLNKQSISVFVGKKVEYNVIVEYTGNYNIQLNTNSSSADTKVKVWVDTISNPTDYALDSTNISAGENKLGTILLQAGTNKITFENTGSGNTNMTGFKLEALGTGKKVELGTGSYTITGSNGTTATRNKTTVPTGGKMSIFVNAFNGGNYKLFANNVNTASTSLKYSVGDAKANIATVAGEEGFAELGIVTLNEGQNVINIENAGTSSIEINNIMLEHTTKKIYAVNEMDGASKEFTFRREIDGVGVTDIGVTNSSCVFNKSSVTLNQKDNFIEYTVIAENAGNYNLNLSCNAQNLDVRIAVLVNDSDQIEYVTMTGGELSRTYKNMGTIRLVEGENRITFKNVTPPANGLVNSSMDKFKLICVDETTVPLEFNTNKWTVTNSNVQSAFRTEVNVTDSKSFEYGFVNAGEKAEYKLSVYYASSNGTPITVNTSVNGTTQITQTVLSKTATADVLEWAEVGAVLLESGSNTLKFDFSNGDLTKIKKIKLSSNKDSSVIDVNKTISEATTKDITYISEKNGWYGIWANISN